MEFLKWLKLTESQLPSEDIFSLRDKTQKSDVSKILGFGKPLVKYSQGSVATLYNHPKNKNLLIKITSHKQDILNIVKAQKLDSPNVVKCFPWENGDILKNVPSLSSLAIIVEKIKGSSMVYNTGEFFDLSLFGRFELAADWLDSTVHKKQTVVLDKHGKNSPEEHLKLSSLFKTLHNLERFYKIELSDFQDNILDDGNRYVIIDMGF
jgi:dsDNA-binding SOS-regulon protein